MSDPRTVVVETPNRDLIIVNAVTLAATCILLVLLVKKKLKIFLKSNFQLFIYLDLDLFNDDYINKPQKAHVLLIFKI